MTRVVRHGHAEPVAFWSYTREDDAAEGGRITELAALLARRAKARTGTEVPVYVDLEEVPLGGSWNADLEAALSSATFLVPIITPLYFESPHCRWELERFLELMERPDRDRLITPIYYLDVPDMALDVVSSDPLVEVVKALQFEDWREVGLEDDASHLHRKAVRRLVDGLLGHRPASSVDRVHRGVDRTEPMADAGSGATSIDEVLDALQADGQRLAALANEFERALDDERAGDDPDDNPAGFAGRLAAAHRLAFAIEAATAELTVVSSSLLARIRQADAGVARSGWQGPSRREAGGPDAVDEALEQRARSLDGIVSRLEAQADTVVEGMAWAAELNGASGRLSRAVAELGEVRAIVHGWEQDAGQGGRGPMDDVVSG